MPLENCKGMPVCKLSTEYKSDNKNLPFPYEVYRRICKDNLWFINVLSRELLKGGNVSLSRNSGFASISFLSSTSMIFRADLVSPYFESCSFFLIVQKTNVDSRTSQLAWKRSKSSYLKLSRVSSWVISLKSSSLKDAKTFRSLTRISTAFARSCLMAGNIKIVKTWMTNYKQTSKFITPKQTKSLNYSPNDRCQHSPFIFYSQINHDRTEVPMRWQVSISD